MANVKDRRLKDLVLLLS